MSGTYLLVQIIGAAALLLWGVRMARTSVTRAYGDAVRVILPRKLGNRFAALLAGAVAATILQSSTAVAVFIASLAGRGAVPAVGGLAVMLGADAGSAAVAALLSLNIKGLWPVLIAAGYILHSLGDETKGKKKQFGRFALGLGLVLIALTFMDQVSGELAASKTIGLVVSSLADEPALAALAFAALTWLAHSSIAMLLFLSSLVNAGIIPESALIAAAVLGINLGGGMPALVMTWKGPVESRRIILGNALFRLIGVAVGMLFLDVFVKLYDSLPGEAGFRVLMLHIAFNILLVALFIAPLGRFAALLERLLPTPPKTGEEFGPRYIPTASGEIPAALPLSALTREILRMSDYVLSMLVETGDILDSHQVNPDRIRRIKLLDDKVDTLYKAIRGYAIELTRSGDLPPGEMRRITGLFRFAVNLENSGDLIEKSLLDITAQKNKSRRSFSQDGVAELSQLFAFVIETMQLSAEVIMTWRADIAQTLRERNDRFKGMINSSSEQHIERLRLRVPGSIETSSFHLDIINDLQRINSLVSAIAGDVIASEESGSPAVS